MWHLQHSVSIWIPVRKRRNQIKMHIQIIVMVKLSVDKQINITMSYCWLKSHLFGCFLKAKCHFRNKKFYCWGFSWSKTNNIFNLLSSSSSLLSSSSSSCHYYYYYHHVHHYHYHYHYNYLYFFILAEHVQCQLQCYLATWQWKC